MNAEQKNWQRYSALSVKICRNAQSPPFQWIFAVDDAWLHPDNLQVANESNLKAPVFEKFGEISVDGWSQRYNTLSRKPVTSNIASLQTTGAAKAPNLADAAVADKLITTFVTDKNRVAGDDYGICFCSFEYFIEHFKDEINKPQNAIFFDLNHKLRALDSTLDTTWVEKFQELKVFGDGYMLEMVSLHGWLLHFATKLGAISDTRCVVNPNHILIVSSALGGTKDVQGSGEDAGAASRDAFAQYATVQRAMWDAIKADPNLTPDSHMIDYGFSPLPKNLDTNDASAELLPLGLEIFDRTFIEAGKWTGVQKLLFQDAAILWTSDQNCGHPNSIDGLGLEWRNWWPTENLLQVKAVKDCFQCHVAENGGQTPTEICIKYSRFKAVLEKSLVHRHFASFNLNISGDDFQIRIPSNPTIFWIATFIDFLDNLRPDRQGRVKPTLEVVKNGTHLVMTITLDETGISRLKKHYTTKTKQTGATPALLAISTHIAKLHEYKFAEGLLIGNKRNCASGYTFSLGSAGAEVLFPPHTPNKTIILIKLSI